jgi:hypothetical protein
MSMCKGRNVSATHRFSLYDESGEATKEYYFTELGCRNRVISDDLCGVCLQKDSKLKDATIKGNKIKDKDGKRIWQPRVLHGKIGSPIPPWSQIEDGEWFNSMLKKGFRKQIDMMKLETVSDSKEVKPKRVIKKVNQVSSSNIIVELKPKMYIDTIDANQAIEIVKVEVKPLVIEGKQYYYETNKNKVYTTDFSYVGRYDTKNEILSTEYPDSDAEPSFTS